MSLDFVIGSLTQDTSDAVAGLRRSLERPIRLAVDIEPARRALRELEADFNRLRAAQQRFSPDGGAASFGRRTIVGTGDRLASNRALVPEIDRQLRTVTGRSLFRFF